MAIATVRKINTAEAKFISDISERDVHRIAAEGLLADRTPSGADRRFELLDLILVHFYFHAVELTKSARLGAITKFIEKFGVRIHLGRAAQYEWIVNVDDNGNIKADFSKNIQAVQDRIQKMEATLALVSSEKEILNGEPVFTGTRVPVRTVEGFLKKGDTPEKIIENFPSLTHEMVASAQLWTQLNPPRGRPKSFSERNPDWELRSSEKYELAGP